MWELIKQHCNNNPQQIAKTIVQCAIIGAVGAAWFYIIALCILLIGG